MWMLTGCGNDAQVNVYDKQILSHPPECLSLHIVPLDKEMERYLQSLYRFKADCPTALSVSYKSGIVCNSHYNAQQKALSNFPNSYLTMEIRKGFSLRYSYYIDLDHKPDKADLRSGFARIRKDLKLSQ